MTAISRDVLVSRKSYLQQLLAQAWPIYLGQIAIIAQGIIDTIMAGHASAKDTATRVAIDRSSLAESAGRPVVPGKSATEVFGEDAG